MNRSQSKMESKLEKKKQINQLFETFEPGLTELGIHDASRKLSGERSIRELRKGPDRRDQDDVSVLTLKETDDVLRWEVGSGFQPPTQRRRRRRGRPVISGQVIRQFKFENLKPNQVDEKLRDLDATLNNHQGYWELTKNPQTGSWERGKQIPKPVASGKILLIVHGTFSNTDNNLSAFNDTRFGVKYLDDAAQRYDQVMAFSHPTIGVSPFTNAVSLASFFRDSKASVDVVCHSRGGLIARWWNEVVDSQANRKVRIAFMGSTLGGTSLASPYQIKNAMDLLLNISRAITTGAKVASALIPPASGLFAASIGINRIFTNVIGMVTKTPIIDAGIALVPGLNGQSRQGANSEILALRENFCKLTRTAQNEHLRSYRFLTASFEPPSVDAWWKFWKYFNKQRIADFAADRIFPHDNDLVVDTASMNELCDPKALSEAQLKLVDRRTYRFRSNSGVHHLNYLSNANTIKEFRKLFR